MPPILEVFEADLTDPGIPGLSPNTFTVSGTQLSTIDPGAGFLAFSYTNTGTTNALVTVRGVTPSLHLTNTGVTDTDLYVERETSLFCLTDATDARNIATDQHVDPTGAVVDYHIGGLVVEMTKTVAPAATLSFALVDAVRINWDEVDPITLEQDSDVSLAVVHGIYL